MESGPEAEEMQIQTINGTAVLPPDDSEAIHRASAEKGESGVGAGISFKNLVYTVGLSSCCKPAKNRVILQNISGDFKAGELSAILGPSGSGKTTLLNLLGGRAGTGGKARRDGTISIGGQDINPVKWRTRIAYVMQDDSLFATSTVRETLLFSARMRLAGVPEAELNAEVDKLLVDLRLTQCADTIIGSTTLRGVSGGERKRCAVGVELVARPNILILDEPTSGLDSYAAYTLIERLHAIAHSRKIAVVMTIHQPSSELFAHFDRTIFLRAGQIVYHGHANGVAAYCDAIGHPIPPNTNPADHVLFVAQTADEDLGAAMVAHCPPHAEAASGGVAVLPPTYRPSLPYQLYALVARLIVHSYRDVGSLVIRLAISLIMNTAIALIFQDALEGSASATSGATDGAVGSITPVPGAFDATATAATCPRPVLNPGYNVLIQLGVGAMFSNSQAILLTFPLERPVFIREINAGMYYSGTYFVSRMFTEIPLVGFQIALSLIVPYFVIGFSAPFWQLWGTLTILGIASSSISLMLGCATASPKRAMEMTPLLFVPQILFSGVFIPMRQIPGWLRWIQYVTNLKYASNLLAIAEFEDGTPILEANDINVDQWWLYLVILIGMTVLFRVIAAIALSIRSNALE